MFFFGAGRAAIKKQCETSAMASPQPQAQPESQGRHPSATVTDGDAVTVVGDGPAKAQDATAVVVQEKSVVLAESQSSRTSSDDSPAMDEDLVEQGGAHAGPSNPFAGGIEGGVTYMSLSWWRAGLLMVAETISLGILALPHALSILGLVPGVFFLVVFGALATYTGFVIGQLRLRHEHIHSTADAGEMLLGRLGKEVVMAGQILFVVFIMGAHLTSFSLAVTVLMGDSQVCSVLLLFAGFILSFLLTIPRTLRHMSYYCIASFLSILAAVVTTMVAVGIERPTAHNDHLDIRLWPQPGLDFFSAFNAVSAIIFAYAAHVAFFTFISELKDPRDFPKALTLLQITDVSMYIVTAVVIYVFSGNDVAALALDSARKDWRKVAFGVALPTIVIAGVINGHIAVKWIYVRLLRDSKEDLIHKKTLKARGIWIVVAFVTWLTAWLISEIIPLFGDLVGLTGALFGSWFTYGLQGFFWFMMMYKREGWRLRKRGDWQMGWRKRFLTALNLLNILIGFVVFIAGTLSASKVINDHTSTAGKPFSCTIRA